MRHDNTDLTECALCDLPEFPGGIAVVPNPGCQAARARGIVGDGSGSDVDAIVKSVTDAVMALWATKPFRITSESKTQ